MEAGHSSKLRLVAGAFLLSAARPRAKVPCSCGLVQLSLGVAVLGTGSLALTSHLGLVSVIFKIAKIVVINLHLFQPYTFAGDGVSHRGLGSSNRLTLDEDYWTWSLRNGVDFKIATRRLHGVPSGIF